MPAPTKILVVDDDESLRTIAREELRAHGFSVQEADGGFMALEMLEANKYNLVILDIRMQDLDGLEVLRNIRAKNLAQKVIMLTGVNELKVAQESLLLGASDFMTKPFEFGDLLACIDRVMKE